MSAFTSQARTILGNLTTTWTPPPDCIVNVAPCGTCSVVFKGQTCTTDGPADEQTCWPATTSGVPEPNTPLNGWGFYSPGLICPSGHWSACAATAGGSSGWKVQFLQKSGETAIGCCPTGYTCSNLNGQTCFTAATSSIFEAITCQDGTSGAVATKTVPDPGTSNYAMFAPMIQLAYRSTDLLLNPSSGITTTESTTIISLVIISTEKSVTGTTYTATASPTNSSAQSSTTNQTGLTAGLLAGIGVVVGIAVFGSLIVAIILWRRGRRQKETEAVAAAYYATSREIGGAPKFQGTDAVIHEAPAENYNAVELSGDRFHHEMSGSTTYI